MPLCDISILILVPIDIFKYEKLLSVRVYEKKHIYANYIQCLNNQKVALKLICKKNMLPVRSINTCVFERKFLCFSHLN